MEFKKNDLVWIKTKGFPVWPGFIIDSTTAQYLGDLHQVEINNNNIVKYNENYEKYSKQKIKKKRYYNSFNFAIDFSQLINQKELNCDDFFEFINIKNEENLKFTSKDLKIFINKFKNNKLLEKIESKNNSNDLKLSSNNEQKNNNEIKEIKNENKKEKLFKKKLKKNKSYINEKRKKSEIENLEDKENKENKNLANKNNTYEFKILIPCGNELKNNNLISLQ